LPNRKASVWKKPRIRSGRRRKRAKPRSSMKRISSFEIGEHFWDVVWHFHGNTLPGWAVEHRQATLRSWFQDADANRLSSFCWGEYGPGPNQDDFARKLSLHMFKCFNQAFTFYRTFKTFLVDLAWECQCHCRWQGTPLLCHPTETGRLPIRAQVVANISWKEKPNSSQTRFLRPDAVTFFILGQSPCNQASTNSFSCSTACGNGFAGWNLICAAIDWGNSDDRWHQIPFWSTSGHVQCPAIGWKSTC